jgi:carboxypeptidase C (cathepsin A)
LFERWLSQLILGESYGGLRVAGLSSLRQVHDGTQRCHRGFQSVHQTLRFSSAATCPMFVSLPTYAATAWYLNSSGDVNYKNLSVTEVVERAERLESMPALLKEPAGDKERDLVWRPNWRLTGLSKGITSCRRTRISCDSAKAAAG